MCVRMTPVTEREAVAHPDNTAPCDDGLYCTQIDECQNGLCIGRDDPCIDNTTYCDGVEYCQEDVATSSATPRVTPVMRPSPVMKHPMTVT